jgi:hypothetical protein
VEIPWDVLGQGSPWALLGLTVLAIIRGLLVPRSTVNLLLKTNDEKSATIHLLLERLDAQGQQFAQALEYMRTADAVFRTLPRARQDEAGT